MHALVCIPNTPKGKVDPISQRGSASDRLEESNVSVFNTIGLASGLASTGGGLMLYGERSPNTPRLDQVDTYDLASSVMVMKAVDLALRRYFGVEDWLTARNKTFPGLRR